MKWINNIFLMVALILGLVGCGQDDTTDDIGTDAGGDLGEEAGEIDRDMTITLGLTNWTSTIPPTYIAKEILEDLGYTVELQPADPGPVYAGLSRGDIDVFMDAWLPEMHANYMDQFEDNIESISVSYHEGEMGWVVPEYVEGINSISDLKGNEEMFDGQIYGIEEGAGMTESGREMIDAYDLNLTYIASSEAGMLSEARRSIANEEPILFVGWRPHPMFVDWDLRVLEEDEEQFHPTSEVHIVANRGLEEKAPEVYEFFSNWSIDIMDVEEMIIEFDQGADEEDLAREWIENNQEEVERMLGRTEAN